MEIKGFLEGTVNADHLIARMEVDPGIPYYHCTSQRNWESIQKNGWSAPIDESDVANYPVVFLQEIQHQDRETYSELVDRLPNEIRNELRDDELVRDIKQAVKRVHDDSEFIWVSEEEKFEQFGDVCLSVNLPEDSAFMVHDMGLGMLFRVPESPIKSHRFERER